MPIVISRVTGEVKRSPATPAQQESLLGMIIKAYIEKHPEVFSENRTDQSEVKA
jgi:hypothetical protein